MSQLSGKKMLLHLLTLNWEWLVEELLVEVFFGIMDQDDSHTTVVVLGPTNQLRKNGMSKPMNMAYLHASPIV